LALWEPRPLIKVFTGVGGAYDPLSTPALLRGQVTLNAA
jgi:hypothetical protein